MESAYVKTKTYIDFGIEHNDKDTKFKVDDHVRISNIEVLLQRAALQIGFTKSLESKKENILYHGHMLLMISKVKKLLDHSTKKSYIIPSKQSR